MAAERRRGERVTFERGIRAQIVAIDGAWARDCVMEDISETGAKIAVPAAEGFDAKEFFLLLASSGLIYRRCELAWSNGDQIGVSFVRPDDKKKSKAKRTPQGVDA